jgi:hypothetical protein
MRSLPLAQPDCRTYPCKEECCSAGVDIFPAEREALIREGLGTEAHFTGPEVDEEGDSLYRTALGPRGCIFLDSVRGCTLHHTGFKPSTCIRIPSNQEDVDEMLEDDMFPCHKEWRFETDDAT